jgi:hypothetical protein
MSKDSCKSTLFRTADFWKSTHSCFANKFLEVNVYGESDYLAMADENWLISRVSVDITNW